MTNNVLVVGASGAIGQALVEQLASEGNIVYAVSRDGARPVHWPETVSVFAMPQHDEQAMEQFKADLMESGVRFLWWLSLPAFYIIQKDLYSLKSV